MKRTLILLTLFQSFHVCMNAQNAPEHSLLDIIGMPPLTIEDFGFKGSVHTVHQKSFVTMGIKENSSGEVFMEFDKFGKIVKDRNILSYNGMSLGDFERIYTYNENGKIAEMKWTRLDITGELPEYSYFKYNAKGQLISSEYIAPTGFLTFTEWLYNTNGALIGWQETKGLAAQPAHIKQFTFDQKNRVTKVTSIMSSDEYGLDTIIYAYSYTDGVLRPTGFEVFVNDPNSTFEELGKEIRTYNASNDHVQSTWTSNLNYTTITSYKYDKEGNWMDRRTTLSSKEREERTFTYFTELTPHIYRKSIAEAMTPSINNFASFAQSIQMQSKNATELMEMINVMQMAAIEDLKKLQALGDINDNSARSYAIQYLTLLGSAETRSVLREVATAQQNIEPLRVLSTTLTGHRNNMSTELFNLFK